MLSKSKELTGGQHSEIYNIVVQLQFKINKLIHKESKKLTLQNVSSDHKRFTNPHISLQPHRQ